MVEEQLGPSPMQPKGILLLVYKFQCSAFVHAQNRDLLRSNKKYLEVPVPHGTKSFSIVESNNAHPIQLDPTIGNDLVP